MPAPRQPRRHRSPRRSRARRPTASPRTAWHASPPTAPRCEAARSTAARCRGSCRLGPPALASTPATALRFPALDLAIDAAVERAGATCAAAVAVTHSHHFGVAGHHVERVAERGLIGLIVGNSPGGIAPWGGRRALLGTNPIAFACPRREAPPLVIDVSLAKVARGKVMLAAQQRRADSRRLGARCARAADHRCQGRARRHHAAAGRCQGRCAGADGRDLGGGAYRRQLRRRGELPSSTTKGRRRASGSA